jgi:holo-[acyl-carrier protein] synthase
VRKALQREGFLTRCYRESEINLLTRKDGTLDAKRAAGNFAVKEAVSKVFGTGFRTMALIDIEVLRDELGKPYVNLYEEAERIAKSLTIQMIHISITNTEKEATAFAIGESVRSNTKEQEYCS